MPLTDEELAAIIDGLAVEAPPREETDEDLLPTLRFTAWEGKEIPERKWLVPGWVPSGYVTALYGDGGVGKSLLAQQLMTACALGRPWVGIGVEKCRSVGLFCEDDDEELVRRQERINWAYQVRMRHLGDMETISRRVGEDNSLMNFDRGGNGTVTSLWKRFRATLLDRRARLAIIDTAADTFGGNELVRSEVRRYVSVCLGGLARDIDGAVLLCAHPSVRGLQEGTGAGGSTAWSNTVRSRLYFRPLEATEGGEEPDRDARILQRVKTNYARVGDEIPMRWEDGIFRPEGAEDGGLIATLDEAARKKEIESAILVFIRARAKENRHVSPGPTSPSYLPKCYRKSNPDHRYSFRELEAAMERLFADQIIVNGTVRSTARNAINAILIREDIENVAT